jgi:hypothetical protein
MSNATQEIQMPATHTPDNFVPTNADLDALVKYWTNEARHLELACGVGDRDTAEYSAVCLATARSLTLLRTGWRDGTANLQAAAPDLLAALSTIVSAMPKDGGMVRLDGDELAAARAAIAKATAQPEGGV